MTRAILAIATAFLTVVTVLASAAEACISCQHVPVVARGASTSHTATPYATKRYYKAAKKQRARARAIARAKARARAIARAKAKAKAKAKAVAAAKAAEEAKVTAATESENSTISTSGEVAEVRLDEPEKVAATSEEPGCKKFFPAVGMTLSVPCE